MVVKGSDSRKRVSLVRGNVAQSIVDQGRGVCVLSAEVQEAGRLGLRSAARQPSVGEVVRFEDVSNANGRHGCHRGRLSARRHARERRRTRRYETAWRLLEDSRSSAAAAPSGGRAHDAKALTASSLRVRGNRRKSEKAAPAKGVEKMTGERRSNYMNSQRRRRCDAYETL